MKLQATFLTFARKVPISGENYGKASSIAELNSNQEQIKNYASEFNQMPEIYRTVQKRLNLAYQRNARQYNLHKRDVEFSVGDKVWKRNKVLSDASKNFSAKLAEEYVLCTVSKKLSRLVWYGWFRC